MINKIIAYIIIIGLIDIFIPIPIMALILLYAVVEKPAWFRDMVRDIYGD